MQILRGGGKVEKGCFVESMEGSKIQRFLMVCTMDL